MNISYMIHASLLFIVPIIGTLFIATVPKFDIASIRQIAQAAVALPLFFVVAPKVVGLSPDLVFAPEAGQLYIAGVIGDFKIIWTLTEATLLLAPFLTMLFLFVSRPKRIEQLGKPFIIAALVLLELSTVAITVRPLYATLFVAHGAIWCVLFLALHFGWAFHGSATLQTVIFFVTCDTIALSGLPFVYIMLPTDIAVSVVVIAYLTAALSRMLVPILSPWSRQLFDNAPSELITLFVGMIAPIGTQLFRLFLISTEPVFTQAIPDIRFGIVGIAVVSAMFRVFGGLQEKNLVNFAAMLASVFLSIGVAIFPHLRSQTEFDTGVHFIIAVVLSIQLLVNIGEVIQSAAEDKAMLAIGQRLWFCAILLLLCIPGVGVGVPLWRLATVNAQFIPVKVVIIGIILYCILASSIANMLRRTAVGTYRTSHSAADVTAPISPMRLWITCASVFVICWILER